MTGFQRFQPCRDSCDVNSFPHMASDEFTLMCDKIDDAFSSIEQELDGPCTAERREELCRESQRLTEAMLAIMRRRREGGSP